MLDEQFLLHQTHIFKEGTTETAIRFYAIII